VEVLAGIARQTLTKNIKGIHIGKEETKWLLVVDDIIHHIENPECTKKENHFYIRNGQ
jgi:hypothetical protein